MGFKVFFLFFVYLQRIWMRLEKRKKRVFQSIFSVFIFFLVYSLSLRKVSFGVEAGVVVTGVGYVWFYVDWYLLGGR